jgi:protein-tyrosine-phosphatase
VDEQRSFEEKGPAVLFVCTANICRSPMAVALFLDRLKKEDADWQEWQIDSAGTWALDGAPAAKNSRLVMAERGLNIIDHRAKTVDAALLQRYDLILTMEPGQKEALQIEFPDIANRIFLLSEMDEGSITPVKDPYGGPFEGYLETADTIDKMIEKGLPKILLLVSEKKGN